MYAVSGLLIIIAGLSPLHARNSAQGLKGFRVNALIDPKTEPESGKLKEYSRDS